MNRGWIAVVFAVLAGSAQAQSTSEKYDLAERCSRRAAELFAKEQGGNIINTSTGQIVTSYQNHYNSRLDKCFYFQFSNVFERGKAPSTVMSLTDLNENKDMAIFAGSQGDLFVTCEVQDKVCQTEQEWRELIRPFMED